MSLHSRKRQRGVALFIALIVAAIAAIVAAGIAETQALAVYRIGGLHKQQEAWWYAIGVENWVGKLLKQDAEDNETDHLQEFWAQPLNFLPIEGGFISGRLVDQQGKFNLNNLAANDPQAAQVVIEQLQRLLENIEGIDSFAAKDIAFSVRDWIDPDIDPTFPGGAEDDYYLGLEQPYRAANQPMQSISELLLVKGVTEEVYRALEPHLTALPAATRINVNTASAPVLASLGPEISPQDVERLLLRRQEAPYESVQEFLQEDALAGRQIDESRIAVQTQYFLIDGETHVGTGKVKLYSLIFRDDQGRTQVLRHSRNTY